MVNNVVLVGRLTKDIELKKTQSGKITASFTIACNRTKEITDFINCVVWNQSAQLMAQYTKKGDLVGIVGSIQTRNYEGNDGKKVYVTEILVREVKFLESKKQKEQTSTYAEVYSNSVSSSNNFNSNSISDEFLPF